VLSILDADDDMQVVTVSKDGMAAAATGADEMTQVMESAESAIVGEGRILVPIRLEGRAIGVLDLQSNGVAQFEQQHAHFASRLADHAAIAIENARLYERIDRANEATSQFVSQVTHKLRTPLTSIRGYAGLLGNERVGSLTPKQKAFAEAIERNVDWMEVLVCDLQDISQIEAGEFRLRREAVPLISALKEAFQATEGQMEARSHEVRWDIPGDLPAVLADPASLTKIFANLLSNACKYTPDGGHIDVRAQCSEGSVQCTVTDDGIGISPEDQAQVFTKFFRSEDAAVRGMPGTGLGLSIVKHLVEMHGGETTVESQPGRGTAVTFTLPVARIG
jgi:signal transduction histidine kinase